MKPVARLVWRMTRLPLIALAVFLIGLSGCQSRFIYFPRPYRADLEAVLPKQVKILPFTTGEGNQSAFWIPPRAGGAPRQVWLCHSGNGSQALDWLPLVLAYPASDVGFLLVDYPGYGRCEGSSTPGRILANSSGAVAALAQRLSLTAADLDGRMCVLGHSLGAACALQYAAAHPVSRVVVVAPFTSMADMVDHVLFWPAHLILWHRFDNRARMDELAQRTPPPAVLIIHGTLDEVIPVAMGRELAATHPAFAALHEIPNADHNGIIDAAQASIIAAMMGAPAR